MRYVPSPRTAFVAQLGLALLLPAGAQAALEDAGVAARPAPQRGPVPIGRAIRPADRPAAAGVAAGASTLVVPDTSPGAARTITARVSLMLDAVAIAGGPSLPASWTLLALGDPARTIFTSQGHIRPTVPLGPGRYELRLAYGALRLVEQFEIAAGTPAGRQLRRVVLNAGTLRPTAGLGANSPPLDGRWTVVSEAVPGQPTGDTVATSTARMPVFHLARGRYRLRFESGHARAETVVTVTAGGTAQPRLVLGAAEVTLVSLRDGRPLLDVRWQVFARPGNGGAPAGTPLADSAAPRARFVLPAGAYLARVRADGLWYEQPFVTTSGMVREIPLALP